MRQNITDWASGVKDPGHRAPLLEAVTVVMPLLLLAIASGRATITVAEMAELLGVSEWSIYKAIRADQFPIPVLRVGRRILISKARVDEVLGCTGQDEDTLASVTSSNGTEASASQVSDLDLPTLG